MNKRIIEKAIKRELSKEEFDKLMKASYLDIYNWTTYHQRDKAS